MDLRRVRHVSPGKGSCYSDLAVRFDDGELSPSRLLQSGIVLHRHGFRVIALETICQAVSVPSHECSIRAPHVVALPYLPPLLTPASSSSSASAQSVRPYPLLAPLSGRRLPEATAARPGEASSQDSSMPAGKDPTTAKPSLIALRRITIVESGEGQADMLAAEGHFERLRASGYDLVALQPASEASAVKAAREGWVDILVASTIESDAPTLGACREGGGSGSGSGSGLRGSSKGSKSNAASRGSVYSIRWHKPQLEAILYAGVPLEARYGRAIASSVARAELLQLVASLRPLVRGRGACLLLSSGCSDDRLLRGPHDIAAVLSAVPGTGFGSVEECLKAQWLAPAALLQAAEHSRFRAGRGILDVTVRKQAAASIRPGRSQSAASGGAGQPGTAKARVVERGQATMAELAAREQGSHFDQVAAEASLSGPASGAGATSVAGQSGGAFQGESGTSGRGRSKLQGTSTAPYPLALSPLGAAVAAGVTQGRVAPSTTASGAVPVTALRRAIAMVGLGEPWRGGGGMTVGADGEGIVGAGGGKEYEAAQQSDGASSRIDGPAESPASAGQQLSRSQRRRLRRKRQRQAVQAAGELQSGRAELDLKGAAVPTKVTGAATGSAAMQDDDPDDDGDDDSDEYDAGMEGSSDLGGSAGDAAPDSGSLGLGSRLRAMIEQGKKDGTVRGRSGAVERTAEAAAKGDSAAAAMQEETGLKFVDF